MPHLLFAVAVSCSPLAFAQSAAQDDASQERLEAMTARARLLRAAYVETDAPARLELLPRPVLRYSDPARRDTDGTMWLWTENSRPVIALCLFTKPDEAQEWNYEFVSLSDRPLRVDGRPDWSWTPRERARSWTQLDEPVADRPRDRARQMRGLVREFQASEVLERETYHLELKSAPLYRYAAEGAGVIDGALFVFSYGTNPEILAHFEARSDASSEARWHVSFARLGAAELTVRRSEAVVWQVPAVLSARRFGPLWGFDPREPYFSVWGPDPIDDESR